jgi:hypothetical protein
MLTAEKHCEMLSANTRDRAASIVNGFRLFVQLYSAIIGGAIVLRLQHGDQIAASFVRLSEFLLILITIASCLMVGDAFRAWLGQRKKLSEVAGKDAAGKDIIQKPNLMRQSMTIVTMFAVMAISLILFLVFNPLRIAQ